MNDRSATEAANPKPVKDVPSLEAFVQRLIDCGLMSVHDYQAFFDDLPASGRPVTARQLAKEMLARGKITRFQALAIYQGKTHGLVVGNYVVLDRLGKGGMGQVYKAKHSRMERIVALKALPSVAAKSLESVQRFQREVRAAAMLSHPNIVTAFDADEVQGVHFLVMEFVDGMDLSALVKQRGALAVSAAVDYVLQAARGLEYAHRHGIIHRDIKPHNLLIDSQRNVKVLDMGLARIEETMDTEVADNEGLTKIGQVMGTLDYMAPEQALDTSHADARADVYSLGCTLHYLLTGRPPYRGDTVAKKIVAHREQAIPSLRKKRPDVDDSLDAVFRKMLAKRPEDRQQSMTEVIAALERCRVEHAPTPHLGKPSESALMETMSFNRADVDTSSRKIESAPFSDSFLQGPLATNAWPSAPSRRLYRAVVKRRKISLAVAVGLGFLIISLGIIVGMRTKEGILAVEIDEPNVTVQVLDEKGKVVIELPGRKGTLAIEVDPGKHRLRVEKDGFIAFAKEFSIASGGRETIRAELKPLAPAPSPPPLPPPADAVVEKTPDAVAGSNGSTKDADAARKTEQEPVGRKAEEAAPQKKAEEESEFGKPLRIFNGHSLAVFDVAFSTDGNRAITASKDASAIIWDVNTGKIIHVLSQTNILNAVALSPDGKRALDGGNDFDATLWDTDTAQYIRVFKGHSDRIDSVTFSPDGKRVLTGSWDKTAILWDAESGEQVRVFKGHTDHIFSAVFSPDGKQVLTGSEDKTAILWDAESAAQVRVFSGHSSTLSSVAFSPDGKRLLTGSYDNTAILWETATGNHIRTFSGHGGFVFSVAFSPDGQRMLTGSRDSTAILWNTETGSQIRVFKGHGSAVYAAVFSPDGKRALTCSWDKTAMLWNLENTMTQPNSEVKR